MSTRKNRAKTPKHGRRDDKTHRPVGVRHVKIGAREIITEGISREIFHDLFHYFMTVSWPQLFATFALFFLAFMPQFVHPERGSVFIQFAVLGLIFVALSSLYTTLIALSIRPLGRIVKHLSWIGRWQGKIIGTVFIGLGIKVATQHR